LARPDIVLAAMAIGHVVVIATGLWKDPRIFLRQSVDSMTFRQTSMIAWSTSQFYRILALKEANWIKLD